MAELPKPSSPEDKKTFIDYEDDTSAFVERQMPSNANSKKALKIIQENSEILDKILKKKTDPSVPFGNMRSMSVAAPSGTVHAGDDNKRISQSRKSLSVCSEVGVSNPPIPPEVTKPITFNPFPKKPVMRARKKDVGRKLGLYNS